MDRKKTDISITVVGAGYVGLSNAILLAQKYKVFIKDINEKKVEMINNKKSPIVDKDIENYLQNVNLDLKATCDPKEAYERSKYILIATPTDYDELSNCFNTQSVESVIREIMEINPDATVIIKSTVPIGYTMSLREKYGKKNIIFSPEFLRENKALYDNLYPSRIVIGDKTKEAKEFANILLQCVEKKDVPVLFTGPTEAEAIKLFANAYLAMRVAFFNELDTFAEINNLNSKEIIEGVCLDPRIGMYYNNPSFGYGGYCLPKDTKQLLANFQEKNIPTTLIKASVESNIMRKYFIASRIMKRKAKIVGIYRLNMKANSDNFRSAAIIDIINYLKAREVNMIIYEPLLTKSEFLGIRVVNDINEFKLKSDLIVANRFHKELEDVKDKVYTRDLFNDN